MGRRTFPVSTYPLRHNWVSKPCTWICAAQAQPEDVTATIRDCHLPPLCQEHFLSLQLSRTI